MGLNRQIHAVQRATEMPFGVEVSDMAEDEMTVERVGVISGEDWRPWIQARKHGVARAQAGEISTGNK